MLDVSEAGVYPRILKRDNGGEFVGDLSALMTAHNIEGVETLSYSPESNGLIENFNNQMRKMLRKLMIGHQNFTWYNQLDLCCSIKIDKRTRRQRNGRSMFEKTRLIQESNNIIMG